MIVQGKSWAYHQEDFDGLRDILVDMDLDQIEFLAHQIYEVGSIWLTNIHSAIHWMPKYDTLGLHINSPQAHQLTLNYLYKLLSEGKLKAMKIKQVDLDPELGKIYFDNPDDLITALQNDWNKHIDDESMLDLIGHAYIFTLPQNNWN